MTTPDLTPDRLAEMRRLLANLREADAALDCDNDCNDRCEDAHDHRRMAHDEIDRFAAQHGPALLSAAEERDRLRAEVEALRQQFARGGDVDLMRMERDAAVAEVARLGSADVATILDRIATEGRCATEGPCPTCGNPARIAPHFRPATDGPGIPHDEGCAAPGGPKS